MIDSNSFVIYYHRGSYGTFLEWCLNFFTDINFDKELPFNNSFGSSHGFHKVAVSDHYEFKRLTNTEDWEVSLRIHPASLSEEKFQTYLSGGSGPFNCMQQELEYIYTHYTKKIIVLYYNMDSVLTGVDNLYSKVSYQADLNSGSASKDMLDDYINILKLNDDQRKWYYESDIDEKIKLALIAADANKFAQHWNKNKIEDLDRWELREFISLYQFNAWKDQFDQTIYDKLQNIFKDVIFINVQDLESNFEQLIPKIIHQFDLPFVNQNKIETVYKNWIAKQQFANRNQLVEKIVSDTIANKFFNFKETQLTLYDEAFIQKRFRDQGFELQCYNLNIFPKNTVELRKKIIG
jgi:hypothetical protein